MKLKVKLTKAQSALLAHHHGRRLVDHIHLTFKPNKGGGKKLKTSVTILVG